MSSSTSQACAAVKRTASTRGTQHRAQHTASPLLHRGCHYEAPGVALVPSAKGNAALCSFLCNTTVSNVNNLKLMMHRLGKMVAAPDTTREEKTLSVDTLPYSNCTSLSSQKETAIHMRPSSPLSGLHFLPPPMMWLLVLTAEGKKSTRAAAPSAGLLQEECAAKEPC